MALDMLARREHSRRELRDKLVKKGCSENLAADVVQDLEARRLLSDGRFAEALVQARQQKGYGPLRIRKEMQEKGVDGELIEQCIDVTDSRWVEVLRQVRHKKFGDKLPRSYQERARQARFLQYRGFTYDQIQSVLSPSEID
ncbi:MAG: regulatory protein RecX [Acidiferrobacterales bacterium]